jgi:hypothetical protein
LPSPRRGASVSERPGEGRGEGEGKDAPRDPTIQEAFSMR